MTEAITCMPLKASNLKSVSSRPTPILGNILRIFSTYSRFSYMMCPQVTGPQPAAAQSVELWHWERRLRTEGHTWAANTQGLSSICSALSPFPAHSCLGENQPPSQNGTGRGGALVPTQSPQMLGAVPSTDTQGWTTLWRKCQHTLWYGWRNEGQRGPSWSLG